MKIEQAHIDQIRIAFTKMKSREDFLHTLNEAKPLVYGAKSIPFELKQLTWYANPKHGGKRYVEFKIKKKSGSERCIHAPTAGLKSFQKTLSFVLQCVYKPHKAAMGFVKDRSVVDNAKLHVGSNYVYNIDLKDFFPSIDQARVWKTLQLKPFNLNKETSELKIEQGKAYNKSRLDIANIIASLCCAEMEVERKNEAGEWEKVRRNVLPQGAPTSPIITNIVCQKLDYLLSGVGNRFGLRYSRYADDITFSSMHNVYQTDSEFLKELRRIIVEQNFHIKESKTRLQKDGYRKEVTGLLVNEEVNVQRRYIKQLRMWLYYWERYGYEKASSFFLNKYVADKGHVKNEGNDMKNVIAGKLDYLKMVKGADNKLYVKLKERFDALNRKNIPASPNSNEFADFTPIVHSPKKLVEFLKNFSINDSALKYTVHSWDGGRDKGMFKDLEEFLDAAERQYNKFKPDLIELKKNLSGKIYAFLFNKDISKSGWGHKDKDKRIHFGWSSPELLEACRLDSSLNPEDFILPEEYQFQRAGKTLQKFKHIIDVFKNEIEIRDENSALLNLILEKHDKYLSSFAEPEVSNLDNKTFYTDIETLGKALDSIFEGVQKYSQHPNMKYYVKKNDKERIVFNILHKDSFKPGLSIYDDKLKLKRGDFSEIKDLLKNLCDWSIESKFYEGFYRINYLVSEKETPAYESIKSTGGFKHILTFYK